MDTIIITIFLGCIWLMLYIIIVKLNNIFNCVNEWFSHNHISHIKSFSKILYDISDNVSIISENTPRGGNRVYRVYGENKQKFPFEFFVETDPQTINKRQTSGESFAKLFNYEYWCETPNDCEHKVISLKELDEFLERLKK